VDLQRALGSYSPNYGRHFTGQVVNLVGVLALGELSPQQWDIVVGLILDDLYALPAACLILAGLGNAVQLRYLLLNLLLMYFLLSQIQCYYFVEINRSSVTCAPRLNRPRGCVVLITNLT